MSSAVTPLEAQAQALVAPPASVGRVVRAGARAAPHSSPDPLLAEVTAAERAAGLPANYAFETVKVIKTVRSMGATRVALQLPEGLLMYSLALADIIGAFTGAEAAVLGDVTYGACCVDDVSAAALGCALLVHYGHSCLVPAGLTTADSGVRVLYVFVEVAFDTRHLAACVAAAFPPAPAGDAAAGAAGRGGAGGGGAGAIALQGTVQFVGALHEVAAALRAARPDLELSVPQAKPLSPGETLGCTAPRLPARTRALVFVADGRFHLEAAMIANAAVRALRYDPFARALVDEGYDHGAMDGARRAAVAAAAAAPAWGLILGTLGRQGSAAVLGRVRAAAEAAGKTTLTLLASELRPAALARVRPSDVGAWVQVACPRLSIDWGAGFGGGAGGAPLLTPYEAFVAAGAAAPWAPRAYPMDYYARDAGPWGNYYRE